MSDIEPVDKLVGHNIKIARTLRGMTQTQLGEYLDITFQQVQKYETGKNRVSASTLDKVAKALRKPIGWLFDEQLPPSADTQEQQLILRITKALLAIKNNKQRQAFINLLETVSSEEGK